MSYIEKLEDRETWQVRTYAKYRWHETEPIPFTKSLKVGIERGHNNSARSSHYTSVASWCRQ